VSPEQLDPFRRLVVVEVPGGYRFGTLRWLHRPSISFSTAFAAKNEEDPAAVAASRTPQGKKFLVWARFPYFAVRREKSGALVSIRDARYPGSWASVTVGVNPE
jgi:hypothetical protein